MSPLIGGERLRPLLAPRSIAFVGASARPNTPGHDMMRMIRRGGFGGTVHAVNRNNPEIEGYPCVATLADLPAPPDLAVLSVRNERLEGALAAAIAAGAKAAVIFASGVIAGDGDPPLAQRLARMARAAGVPICGPNCMGFYNDLDRVWVCGFPSPRQPAPGSIAFIAHSGSVFGALAHNDPRLRFALAVSPGGEATATIADYIAYAVERPEVQGDRPVHRGRARSAGLCARARARGRARRFPSSRSRSAAPRRRRRAALTHTGALAGSDLAYSALFDRYGVIRVETLDELAATMLLLSTERRAARGGLVAIGDSGGERELMIDLADRAGVPFAAISTETKAAIAARLEPGLEAANPLDAWGTGADFVSHFTALPRRSPRRSASRARPVQRRYPRRLLSASRLRRCGARGGARLGQARRRRDQLHAGSPRRARARTDARAACRCLTARRTRSPRSRGAFAYRDFQARPLDPPPSPPAARAADRQRVRARLRARCRRAR